MRRQMREKQLCRCVAMERAESGQHVLFICDYMIWVSACSLRPLRIKSCGRRRECVVAEVQTSEARKKLATSSET
jgi:hypothetical protein